MRILPCGILLALMVPVVTLHGQTSEPASIAELEQRLTVCKLNAWIRQYAAASGAVYLDHYSALAEERDLRKELTSDGVLPNERGYAVMAPLAGQAIARALANRPWLRRVRTRSCP